MNPLAESLLEVARQHMGLAASAFVTAQLRAIGAERESLDGAGLRAIAARIRIRPGRALDEDRARVLAEAIDQLADDGGMQLDDDPGIDDHRLALDAAATLLGRGDVHRALLAYRDLVQRHNDPPSLQGLARAAAAAGDLVAATDALREAAVLLVRDGKRDRAIAVLEEAVAVAPLDLACHRRLAALYANSGDVTSARCEHARFAEACLVSGDAARAIAEIEYASRTVGESPALRDLERRALLPPAVASRPAAPRLIVVPPPAAAEPPPALAVPDPDPRPELERETVEAATELRSTGKPRAASDLLLGFIASGRPARDAQRLLVSVARDLGRADLASQKCQLLARLLELDGDRAGAVEVGMLARAS